MNTLRKHLPDDSGGNAGKLPLALSLIVAVTLAVYWPVLHNGFIDFDDDVYVTANAAVQQGLTLKGVAWAFTTFHGANWHPLTWLSHMLDVTLYGLQAPGHHATSLLLHILNSLLLCGLLFRWTGFIGRSLVLALLFAIHPLHVESVAWIAERKDVLSTCFCFLTMWAYTGYVRKPTLLRYLPVVICYACGLLAKQMLVTLPLVLLLLDYWPLKRHLPGRGEKEAGQASLKGLLLEKLPLLALSAAASMIILRAHAASRALFESGVESTLLHSGNALLSYVKYIRNMFWPFDLALFYPFEPAAVTVLKVALALIVLIGITALAAIFRKDHPYLLCGWGWYLITLLPVIGFIRVGGQALADRYTYIPLVGLFLMIVWVGGDVTVSRRKGLAAVTVVAVVVVAGLSLLTVRQLRYWQNSYELYAHALSVVERNWLAHNNMGILLAQQYRHVEAIRHFRESLRIKPDQPDCLINLGNAYQSIGDNTAAIDAFREAVRISPTDEEGHFRLGYAYLDSGNIDFAYKEYLQLQQLHDSRARSLYESIQMRSGR
jgi:tetratricopeptide (TPR) repeat protein